MERFLKKFFESLVIALLNSLVKNKKSKVDKNLVEDTKRKFG